MINSARLGHKRVVNLTEHVVYVYQNGRVFLEIPPSGQVAKCKVEEVEVERLSNVPIVKSQYGEVEGLPEPRKDVLYIVSFPVANAKKDRKDLIVPTRLVRDKEGNIIGCRAFQILS